MKSILTTLIYLFFVMNTYPSGPNTSGVPSYLWQSTNTLETYSPALGWTRSHSHGQVFAGYLSGNLNRNYPSVGVSRIDRKDAALTLANLTNNNLDSYEMVFYSGHGYTGGSGFVSYDHGTFGPNQKSYGGWTRWVFADFCQFLRNHSGANYQNMFDGLHAVYGYESDMWYYINSYDCFPWGCSHYRSENKWAGFANYWAEPNGMNMWEAYKSANSHFQYSQGGLGNAPATVYVSRVNTGSIGNWHGLWYFKGHTEWITNVFSGDAPIPYVDAGTTLIHEYVTYGTPTY